VIYTWVAMRMFKSRFTRTGVIAFCLAGVLFAVLRISWVWYLAYRMHAHMWSESLRTVNSFLKFFFPEEIVISFFPIEDPFWHTLFSLILIIGSFFWASALLLLGARKKKELETTPAATDR
jgi:hypothetical protein